MLLLGIDTATRRVGVVLASEQRHARAASSSAVTPTAVRRATPSARARDRVLLRRRSASRSTTSRRSRSASGPGMFTGLRVGVTTAKVLAQALRIPVIPIPSLDLLAYPLRHAHGLVVARDRRRAATRCTTRSTAPVPGGVQRASEYEVGTPDDLVGRARSARRGGAAVRRRRAALRERVRRRRATSSSPAPRTRRRASPRWPSSRSRRYRARGVLRARRRAADVPAQERRRDRLGPEGQRDVATAREAHRAARGAHRRRCAAGTCARCCASRRQVYPTPWTHVAVRERARAALDARVRRRAGRSRGRRLRRA